MLNPDQLRGLSEHTGAAVKEFAARVGIFDEKDPLRPIAQAAATAIATLHDAIDRKSVV